MKRIKNIVIILSVVLFSFGCQNEVGNEITALERRVAALEAKCELINTNINALSTLVTNLQSYIFVKDVTEIKVSGEVTGYAISFSNGETAYIYNGKDQETPIVGVIKDEDGLYYWTITYNGVTDYIYDSVGMKVSATAASPILKIEDGNWVISYDNGDIWTVLGSATGESGTSFISSVQDSTDYIKIVLADESIIRIPTQAYYEAISAELTVANNNLTALRGIYDAINANVFVSTIVPVVDNADTVGYTLLMSDDSSITVYDGDPTDVTIGVKTDTDGVDYWIITYADGTYKWIVNSAGKKVAASPSEEGYIPILGIEKDEDGYYCWTVSYSGVDGYQWLYDSENNRVKAAVATPEVFTNIVTSDDYVTLTISGGTTVNLPRYKVFNVTIDDKIYLKGDVESSRRDTVSYSISDVTSDAAITAIAKDGFISTVIRTDYKSGKIAVTAPETFVSGSSASSLLILVSDGHGHTKTITVSIIYGIKEESAE